MKKSVFLGGTCNDSTWRDELISKLNPEAVSAFNPVVPDWTPECMAEERRQRETSDFCLYVITPRMTGVYSIAEAVDDSNKRPERTLFCALQTDGALTFTKPQAKSLTQMGELICRNGGKCFDTIDDRKLADALKTLERQDKAATVILGAWAARQMAKDDDLLRWIIETSRDGYTVKRRRKLAERLGWLGNADVRAHSLRVLTSWNNIYGGQRVALEIDVTRDYRLRMSIPFSAFTSRAGYVEWRESVRQDRDKKFAADEKADRARYEALKLRFG